VVGNPADFLFRVEAPQTLVDTVAQVLLTEAVAAMPIDEVLTTGRVAMQENAKTRTQEILDRYQSGVQITSASIMAMTLDRSVAEALQDVANATADRDKLQAPEITRSRLYLEAMEKILPKVKLYVLDTDNGHAPLNLRVTGP
jgi:modulator of FtsH protease HflK